MPCDTISTMEIEVGNLDPALALSAMKAAGLFGTYANGKLILKGSPDREESVLEFKRAYAGEVIQTQAKKFGWTLNKTGKFEYEVTKR